MHSVLPLNYFIVLVPYFFNSYKIAKASVFENVSRFGNFSIAIEMVIVYLRAPFAASPIPL